MTMAHLLHCRNERWGRRERQRKREAQDLEREVLGLLQRETERDMADAAGDDVERKTVEEEGRRKLEAMRGIIERARSQDDRKREVPEWLIDDISFNVMVDPVTVRPCGTSLVKSFMLLTGPFTDSHWTILRTRIDTGRHQ